MDVCYFDHLPTDILVNIFQCLPLRDRFSAGMVCKSWTFALSDCRLWEKLQFFKADNSTFVKRCLLLAPNLRSLSFTKCDNFRDLLYGFHQLGSNFSSCRVLELLHCDTCPQDLEILVKFLPDISSLNLSDSKISVMECLNVISTYGYSLKYLNLSYCCNLGDSELFIVSDSFPHLVELDIEGNPYVSDIGLCYVIEKIGQQLALLRLDGENLSDNFVKLLVRAPNLNHFSIAYAENLSSAGFCKILTSLRFLKYLRLHKVANLDDETVANAVKKSPWLKSLVHLQLDDCQSLGDLSAMAFAGVCHDLRYLSMDWWTELSDRGMHDIVVNCPFLEFLSIIGAVKLVGRGSFDLALGSLTARLHQIRLEKCHSFDDGLFDMMMQSLPYLKIYNYYGELVEKT